MTNSRLALSLSLLLATACGANGANSGFVGDPPVDGGKNIGDSGNTESDAMADSKDVFDESVIRTVSITIADNEWNWLNEHATDKIYVPANVVYDGESVQNVGVRYKGNYGTLYPCFDSNGDRNNVCGKLAFKIDFNEYDDNQRFRGLKKINLQSMSRDPTLMREALSYSLYRSVGIATPRTAYVRVEVNGENLGLFLALEAVDGTFTKKHFPDGGDGNLYKDGWPGSTSNSFYERKLKTNENDDPSFERITRFGSELQSRGQSNFEDTLSKWTDLDKWLTFIATARVIDHWDGIFAWYCGSSSCSNHNFYMYESTTSDQFWMIPWDFDGALPSFTTHESRIPDWTTGNSNCNPMPGNNSGTLMMRAPGCDPMLRWTASELKSPYKTKAWDLLDGPLSSTAVNQRIDELRALIQNAVEDDPVWDHSRWESRVVELKSFASARRKAIRLELDF